MTESGSTETIIYKLNIMKQNLTGLMLIMPNDLMPNANAYCLMLESISSYTNLGIAGDVLE